MPFPSLEELGRWYGIHGLKAWLYTRQEGMCGICGDKLHPEYRGGINVDHVVPLGRGGKDVKENMQLVHTECNFLKQNLLDEEYEQWKESGMDRLEFMRLLGLQP